MIKSMTGYGRGEATLFDRKFVVEIKTVNHRYNDISIKIPRIMNSFEENTRKKISENIFRGKTDVYITFQSFSKTDIKVIFNENLSNAYFNEIKKIDNQYNFNQKNYLDMLLRFPDILGTDNSNIDESSLQEMWETLIIALETAIFQIVKMREKEGNSLKRDIIEKAIYINESLLRIKEKAPSIEIEHRDKLLIKVKDFLENKEIDEGRILTEVAIQADKISIDEELTRMFSHIEQLDTILVEGGTVGRKLDFLVQEMNREINTIGSKSNDIETIKIVVDLKSQIEKIREQIQNIE